MKFVFCSTAIPPEDLAVVKNFPALFDTSNVLKWRRQKAKIEAQQIRENDLPEILRLPQRDLEEGRLEGGSLQLGGEP